LPAFFGKGHQGEQEEGVAGVDERAEQQAEAIADDVEAAFMRHKGRRRVSAEMREHTGFKKFSVQQDGLHEHELEHCREEARPKASDQSADTNFGKHGLVAGKAGRVTHIMCGVMQSGGLHMPCDCDDPEADQACGEKR